MPWSICDPQNIALQALGDICNTQDTAFQTLVNIRVPLARIKKLTKYSPWNLIKVNKGKEEPEPNQIYNSGPALKLYQVLIR